MKKKEQLTSAHEKNSRFVQGGTADVHEKNLGWWERDASFNTRADDDIIIYSLPKSFEGRPDLIAFHMYGNNQLDWVVLQYNNIVDINEELAHGSRIVLPTKARLFSSMLVKTPSYGDNDV